MKCISCVICTLYHLIYLIASTSSFSLKAFVAVSTAKSKNYEVREKMKVVKVEVLPIPSSLFTSTTLLQSSPISSATYDRTGIVEEDKTTKNIQIFVRFSPLIGAPIPIPLHVEVMMLKSTTLLQSIDVGNINKNEPCQERQVVIQCLHRFDFLPAEPTKMKTILKLISLQYVPGLLRHRILIGSSCEEVYDNIKRLIISDDDEFLSMVPNDRINTLMGNNVSSSLIDNNLVFKIYNNRYVVSSTPIASIKADYDKHQYKIIIDKLIQIPQEVNYLLDEKKKNSELHIVLNNCYSFTSDLLQSFQDYFMNNNIKIKD